MTTHSDKALATLSLMNTVGTDWKGADIVWTRELREIAVRVICPDCRGFGNVPDSKERCTRCGGGWAKKVTVMVKRMVHVGTPQWPVGTKFDARFNAGCHCHLCNKVVLKTGKVPVVGTGADGVVHGMWVGCDCAKKFLPGTQTVKTPDGKKATAETAIINGAEG